MITIDEIEAQINLMWADLRREVYLRALTELAAKPDMAIDLALVKRQLLVGLGSSFDSPLMQGIVYKGTSLTFNIADGAAGAGSRGFALWFPPLWVAKRCIRNGMPSMCRRIETLIAKHYNIDGLHLALVDVYPKFKKLQLKADNA